MAGFPTGQEKAQTPLGVYVHVPFCATTCDFCAFYQTVPKGDAVRRYLDAVEAEAALVNWEGRHVATAFWGGGTPGLLRPAEIEQLGRVMLLYCHGRPDEWTVELAPANIRVVCVSPGPIVTTRPLLAIGESCRLSLMPLVQK